MLVGIAQTKHKWISEKMLACQFPDCSMEFVGCPKYVTKEFLDHYLYHVKEVYTSFKCKNCDQYFRKQIFLDRHNQEGSCNEKPKLKLSDTKHIWLNKNAIGCTFDGCKVNIEGQTMGLVRKFLDHYIIHVCDKFQSYKCEECSKVFKV